MNKWWQFTKERFEPISHTTMIFLFVFLHVLFAVKVYQTPINPYVAIILFVIVFVFYFKLRLYDEIKDYTLDCKINPMRPLPRGLISIPEVKQAIITCILLQVFLFYITRFNLVFGHIVTILYSLLMYKEFFIREKIRPHLTTYAILHTFVTVLLTFSMFSFLTNRSFDEVMMNKDFLYFSLSNWMLFNIFEFGRKTFQPSEERDQVDTYSSLFKKPGAVLLVLSQVILSMIFINQINFFKSPFFYYAFVILFLCMMILSLMFVFSEKTTLAKIYRAFSSFYIVLFFIILIIGLIL